MTGQKNKSLDKILSPIANELKQIEQSLIANIETDIPLLNRVMEHILSSSSKRLRPAIHCLTARSLGYAGEDVYLIGGLIEYIHTATLLHDDVIDNADFRRKKKSARTIWGNEASVLAGDYLFTQSFRKLAEHNDMPLVKMLSDTTTFMAKGEIIQLSCAYNQASEKQCLKIIEYKTSSLLAFASRAGAHVANAGESVMRDMSSFGLNFGTAFQIIDDLLDYTAELEDTGKTKGVDLKERKITLPLSHFINTAKGKNLESVLDVLNKKSIDNDDFEHVKKKLHEHGSIDYAYKKAYGYTENALLMLDNIPPSPYVDSLKEVLNFCIYRSY